MIDLISLPNLGKANKNFANHVVSRIATKLIGSFKYLESKPTLKAYQKTELRIINLQTIDDFIDGDKIDKAIFLLHKSAQKIDFTCDTDSQIEILKYLKHNLYKIVAKSCSGYDGILKDLRKTTVGGIIINNKKNFQKDSKTLSALRTKKERDTKIKEFNSRYPYTVIKNLLELFKSIFSYNDLSDGYEYTINGTKKVVYSLYNLGEDLGVRTCTYCNRNYIFTIRDQESKSGKLIVPHFDHWFPQSEYFLFTASFYNLIPSCYNCNSSVKSNKPLTPVSHLHPYMDVNIADKYIFTYKKVKNQPIVILRAKGGVDNKKTIETFKFFKLDKIYASHSIELEDLIALKQNYGKEYLMSMLKSFKRSKLTEEEIYSHLFQTSSDSSKHHLKPLSKFRYDILKKLKII